MSKTNSIFLITGFFRIKLRQKAGKNQPCCKVKEVRIANKFSNLRHNMYKAATLLLADLSKFKTIIICAELLVIRGHDRLIQLS